MKRKMSKESISHFFKQIKDDYKITKNNRLETLIQLKSLIQLGYAYHLEKKNEIAIKYFMKAVPKLKRYLILFSGDYRAHLQLSNGLSNLDILIGKKENAQLAIHQYLRVLQLKPDLEEVHYFLASTYLNLGNIKLAVTHYQKELEIDPDNTKLIMNLAWYC